VKPSGAIRTLLDPALQRKYVETSYTTDPKKLWEGIKKARERVFAVDGRQLRERLTSIRYVDFGFEHYLGGIPRITHHFIVTQDRPLFTSDSNTALSSSTPCRYASQIRVSLRLTFILERLCMCLVACTCMVAKASSSTGLYRLSNVAGPGREYQGALRCCVLPVLSSF